jgi:type II secretory pathway pseudopilin PulG
VDWLQRGVRSLRQRDPSREEGFTLVEVVIATTILFIVMMGVAYLGTVAFADVAQARLRQTGTALANQAVEQVRALPYDTVAAGLSTSDLSDDPAIELDGDVYRFGGEQLATHGQSTSATAPLVPHTGTQEIDGVPYTTRVYVTHYEDDIASGAFRVTAIVTWIASVRAAAQNEAQVQTIIFSPTTNTSCQSTATHPYPAPCQPYFFANATGSPGGVRFLAAVEGQPILPGSTLQEATMTVPVENTTVEVEAIAVINASATTSGASYRLQDAQPVEAGSRTWSAQADSDAGNARAPYYQHEPATPQPQPGTALEVSGSNGSKLRWEVSANDTGSATAAAAASNSSPCLDALAVAITNLLPCGTGQATQASTTRAILDLQASGVVGNAQLLSLGGGTNSVAHVSRALTPTSACPDAAVEGCVVSVKRQSLGAVRIGALPGGMATLIPGMGSLVRLDNVTTTVTAAAGIGNGDPVVTRTGTVSWWDEDLLPLPGYQSIDLSASASGSASVDLPPITLDVRAAQTGIRVRMVLDLRTGAASAVPCASPCEKAEAWAQSPVLGTLSYTVWNGANLLANTAMYIDFGTLTANATYRPAA